MKRLSGNRSLVIFFALAFIFTWANWLPKAAADRGLIDVQVPGFVSIIAGYGPALAAVIAAAFTLGKEGLR